MVAQARHHGMAHVVACSGTSSSYGSSPARPSPLLPVEVVAGGGHSPEMGLRSLMRPSTHTRNFQCAGSCSSHLIGPMTPSWCTV